MTDPGTRPDAPAHRAGASPSAPAEADGTGSTPYLDLPVGEFLQALSAPTPAPGGGSAAAITVALAASLCAMTARISTPQLSAGGEAGAVDIETQTGAAGIAARAGAAGIGAGAAADNVTQAGAAGIGARAGAAGIGAGAAADNVTEAGAAGIVAEAQCLRERAAPLAQADAEAYRAVITALRDREQSVGGALSAASTVPMEVAEIGARVAALAATIAERGNPNVRGDAITAALLAAAGSGAASELVRINLAQARGDDRPAQAQQFASEAARHAAVASARR
jgi:formiminotetrahydrofolate cyclodeaminase